MEKLKSRILDEIKRLTSANGGKAPGSMAFESETGIKKHEWYPNLWLRWGDAVAEAGFTPNKFQAAISNETLVKNYISLIRELGRLPVDGEVRRKSQLDKSFPGRTVLSRFGGKAKLLEAVIGYCREHAGHEDVVAFCRAYKSSVKSEAEVGQGGKSKVLTGFVYLMQSGRHYKIGRTNSIGRRGYDLKIQIPVPPRTIYSIETDDPIGVEAYWHKRFEDKRGEGEWFDLTPEDVKAFKRWKRIA